MSRETKLEYKPTPEVQAAIDRYLAPSDSKVQTSRNTLARMQALQLELLAIHHPEMDPETAARAVLTAQWLDHELQQPGKTPPWRGLVSQ